MFQTLHMQRIHHRHHLIQQYVQQLTTDLFVLPRLIMAVHIMVLIQLCVITAIHNLHQIRQMINQRIFLLIQPSSI